MIVNNKLFGNFNSLRLLSLNIELLFWVIILFSVHAAVIAINEAIEKGIADQTIKTLQNPNAVLVNVDNNFAHEYQKELSGAKKKKQENAKLKVKK